MALDRFATLEAFVAVARSGSFARAAEKLGLSRAMVSKHIQALEARLGTRLLNRTTRQVSLTEAGRNFQQRAERLLAELEDAEGDAAQEADTPRGTLRISAPVSFGVTHVAPALAAFLAAHPGLRGDLALNDRVVDVVEEGFDLAVRIGRLPDSMLIARRLAVARLAVIASPGYLSRHGRPTQPDDLAGHNCLTYAYAASRDEWRFVGKQGTRSVAVQGSLRANNGDALREAVLGGSRHRAAADLPVRRRHPPRPRAVPARRLASGGDLRQRRSSAGPARRREGATLRRFPRRALRSGAALGCLDEGRAAARGERKRGVSSR
jgi:DNA-binding transcriptional LysR family regulator